MSLCTSIDTLSMAFLDDELAAEERREIELHLLECSSCRQHIDGERADLALVRHALVAPPAPMLLKARIARALDAEDVAVARRERRRLSQWLLPGSAVAAAAAAILVFVGFGSSMAPDSSAVTRDVVKQQYRSSSLPLEVQGASTGPWLRSHFAPVEPPRFTEPGSSLLGARLLPNGIANRDAAMLSYEVTIGGRQVPLIAVVLKDLRGDELSGGQVYRVGDLVLRLFDADGMPTVAYVDRENNVAYVFASGRLSPGELLRLVGSTDLIARAQQRR